MSYLPASDDNKDEIGTTEVLEADTETEEPVELSEETSEEIVENVEEVEPEQKDIEALYTGTESEARKRFQGNSSYSQ